MKLQDIRIFASEQTRARADALIREVVKLEHFPDSSKFNPYRDYPELVASSKEIDKDGNLLTVSSARKYNFKTGKTALTDNLIAGIFAEIIKVCGVDTFYKEWNNYFIDFSDIFTAGNPDAVAQLITKGYMPIAIPNIDKVDKILDAKLIMLWQIDRLTSDHPYSLPPRELLKRCDRNSAIIFKELTNKTNSSIARKFSLESTWSHHDTDLLFLLCVASRTNPIRLLNWMGLWMTHKESQPDAFKERNFNTQENEMEIHNASGQVIGYQTAPRVFPEALFVSFTRMVRAITWTDTKGNKEDIISDDFEYIMSCILLEEFSEMHNLEWQIITDAASVNTACLYYSDMGMNTPNKKTVRTLSEKSSQKLEARNKHKKHLVALTGNPIFDISLLEEDN